MHGQFYIETNDKGKNFRLVRTKNHEKFEELEELVPHREDVYLTSYYLYENHIVTQAKEDGLPKITVHDYQMKNKDVLKFPEPTYTAGVFHTLAMMTMGCFVGYTSMTSPGTMFKYDFKTKKLKTIKVQEIPSGYDKSEYHSERVWAVSREKGVKVPVSLVYKKSLFKKDGSNPLFLYGYGSYGHAVPPSFNTNCLSLLDEGFVYAIAHIRGGDDLGFNWYEDAKFLNKHRTFNDFIDIAKTSGKRKIHIRREHCYLRRKRRWNANGRCSKRSTGVIQSSDSRCFHLSTYSIQC